jgi:hypothetical protein
MQFEDYFSYILNTNKTANDNRILKLEHFFPLDFEKKQDYFLELFFSNDPFEIKHADLETFLTASGRIKKLKEDRKPSTFLSLFRFLELYRQQFQSQRNDLGTLAGIYKAFENKQIEENSDLKGKILNHLLSARRLYEKWYPQSEQFFKILIQTINQNLVESESIYGKGNGFVNLRKVQSESYMVATFHPYFESLVKFCIMCIAHTVKLKSETKLIQEETGEFILK